MKRRLAHILFAVFALAISFSSLLPAVPVHADPLDTSVDQHIDRSTILYKGKYYFDSKIDNNYTYVNTGDTDGCQDFINYLKNGNKSATFNLETKDPTTGDCDDVKSSITLAHPERADMPFDIIDKNHIQTSDKSSTYTYNDSLKEFLEDGGDSCKDIIKITAGPDANGATLSVLASTSTTGAGHTSYDNWDAELHFNKDKSGTSGSNGSCTTYGPNSYQASVVYQDNPTVLAAAPVSQAGGSGTSTSGAAASPTIQCTTDGILNLSWLICPAINGLVDVVDKLDKLINSQLAIGTDTGDNGDPSQIFDTKNLTAQEYHGAWASFRNIALGLLVIAGLVVIISEALGLEIVDAYTVRKILPRLVIAAIGITLSWQLMRFFVAFSNALGYGVRELIYAPFDAGGLTGQFKLTLSGTAGVAIATGSAIAGLGLIGLLSFVATAALAVVVAFIVIILRQILIIFLIIIAPIAIVAYVLPNTKKIYDLWWDSFSKGLMMFPIIAGFIAMGRIFSAVSLSGASPSAPDQFIGFIAYFAPYFLIPTAFRFAGGALRGIGGFVNDKNRGGFDRLRKFRGRKLAENTQKMANFQRVSDKNIVGRGVNRVLGAGFNPRAVAHGRSGINAGIVAGRTLQGAENVKQDKVFQANQQDEKFLLAVADPKLAAQKRSDANARYEQLRTTKAANDPELRAAEQEVASRTNAINTAALVKTGKTSATRMAAFDGLTKTGYEYDYGSVGVGQMQSTVESIVGSDVGAQANLMNTGQYNQKNAQRLDLAGINNGAGPDIKTGVRKLGNFQRGQAKTGTYYGSAEAWLGKGTVDTKTGKTKKSNEMADALIAQYDSGDPNFKLDDVLEWHGMLANDFGGANDANKIEIEKQMAAVGQLRDYIDHGLSPRPLDQNAQRFITQSSINDQIKARGSNIDPNLASQPGSNPAHP